MQVFWELIFCMNRFLLCLSVRIRHRRCEQRHTNLRNARWFLSCVFCLHCLIIHIFFENVTANLFNEKKELIYILFTVFNESLSLFPFASPWKLSLQATPRFPTNWAVIWLCLTAGNSSGTRDRSYWQGFTSASYCLICWSLADLGKQLGFPRCRHE